MVRLRVGTTLKGTETNKSTSDRKYVMERVGMLHLGHAYFANCPSHLPNVPWVDSLVDMALHFARLRD